MVHGAESAIGCRLGCLLWAGSGHWGKARTSLDVRRRVRVWETVVVMGERFSPTPRNALNNGAPGRIRTADHLVRSQVLYPTELRAHSSVLVRRLVPPFSGQRFALQVLASTLRVSAPAARVHPRGVRSWRSMLGLDASRQPSLTQLSYGRMCVSREPSIVTDHRHFAKRGLY